MSSEHPREGMYFSDARKRAVRIARNHKIDSMRKNQLVCSLKNQVRLHDGEEASNEIQKEVNSDFNSSNDNHTLPKLGYNPCYAKNYDKIFKEM